ncbi:hypothetical protein M8J76_016486 [Diaphorina citri]|nr:hypothetical protein M8J76_016486 [Diaphorina citri]
MKIAVEGCAHGELEKIYDTIALIEKQENLKVDLLICCGDFQSTRNEEDLACMACPPKYRDIYYSGEKQAPILTLFIGGNHEASGYLQELAYGGWVAPNIFYLGYAGVVNIGGLRIGGISGIQKGQDYLKGHFEKAPYTEQTKRSCYHIRNLEVFRLKQLSGKIDIMCSHDWPQGVYHFGNVAQLVKHKPYFKQEIEENRLGSSVCEEVMKQLKPSYWFSAHLHTKFSAVIPYTDGSRTKFLALDKCLPKRRFLQILDIEHKASEPLELKYDHEWLTVLFLTNHLLSVKSTYNYLPGPNNSNERYTFTPNPDELALIANKFDSNFTVPSNFICTAPPYNPNQPSSNRNKQAHSKVHPNTTAFCEQLCIDDPLALLLAQSTPSSLNDSYGSFQSTIPSGLSTPCSKKDAPVQNLGSLQKFKLNLPSPKNVESDAETRSENDTRSLGDSCVILEDSATSVDSVCIVDEVSTVDDSKLLASVKRFTPYRSKMSWSTGPESPHASTLPKPTFDSLKESPLKDSLFDSSKNSPAFDSSAKDSDSPVFDTPLRDLSQTTFNSSIKDSPSTLFDSPCGKNLQSICEDKLVSSQPSTELSKEISSELTTTEFGNEVSSEIKTELASKAISSEPITELSKGVSSTTTGKDEDVRPAVKKFKRRNQSIYQTQDDD